MRHRIITAFTIVLLVCLLIGASHVQARPSSYHNSSMLLQWPGNLDGAGTTMNHEWVSLSGTDQWNRFIVIFDPIDNVSLEAGLQTNGSCGSGNWFWYALTPGNPSCSHPGSLSHDCDIGVEEFTTSQLKVNIDCGSGTGKCPGFGCSISFNTTGQWTGAQLEEDINATWGGELTPTTEVWYGNEYREGTAWSFQNKPSSCNPPQQACPGFTHGSPPEAYWATFPSVGDGGILDSCERSDGNYPCP